MLVTCLLTFTIIEVKSEPTDFSTSMFEELFFLTLFSPDCLRMILLLLLMN